MTQAARSVSSVIRTSQDKLGSLRKHVAFLQKVDAAVAAALPDNAAEHVRVADCGGEQLLLVTDNPAWAARLRYQQRDIFRNLAQRMRIGVSRLEVVVRTLPHPGADTVVPRYLSPGARRVLEDCAGCVEDNPELARALQRLASAGQG